VRTITIEIKEPGVVLVCEDGRFIDHLGKDEALWIIAELLMRGQASSYGGLRTPEQQAAHEKRLPAPASSEQTFFGIVTQFDTTPEKAARNKRAYPEESHGPLLYECYLIPEHKDRGFVEQVAKRFAHNGWTRVAKVIVDIPEGEA
jgi:hypothetical protein